MATATDLVTVATYETVIQAETSRLLLEESGIHALLVNGEISTAEPLLYAGVGVGLQVQGPDAPRAVEILRAHEAAVRQASGDEALVEDEADTSCIACGAAIPEYLEKCPACGWSYT